MLKIVEVDCLADSALFWVGIYVRIGVIDPYSLMIVLVFFRKPSDWMAVVGEFENDVNDYLAQIMFKWTSCWLEKSLVATRCHDRKLLKFLKNQLIIHTSPK